MVGEKAARLGESGHGSEWCVRQEGRKESADEWWCGGARERVAKALIHVSGK